jgi:hypothetical protein
MEPDGEWNPKSLNLRSPKTPQELNIRSYLNYLESLPAFKRFFVQDRMIAVSAGESSKEQPEYDIAPFGIQDLQDCIFKILPEAVKTEYARIVRRIELVKLSIEALIESYAYSHGCRTPILIPVGQRSNFCRTGV